MLLENELEGGAQMKRKFISALLIVALLVTVAMPAIADTYISNMSCKVCGS